MTIEAVNTIHEYITANNLLLEVERLTKAKWKGAGSRPTYYSGLKKIRAGLDTSLVESLMWAEAEALMYKHQAEVGQLAAA